MTLYEIDNRLQELVDPETGEIADYEAFEALDMERTHKLENMACWVKNMEATANGIASEVKALQARKAAIVKRAERIAGYLQEALAGQKFETPRCAVTYRKSTAVEVSDPAVAATYLEEHGYDDCLNYTLPTIDKTALKALLTDAVPVPGCAVVQRQNMQIK